MTDDLTPKLKRMDGDLSALDEEVETLENEWMAEKNQSQPWRIRLQKYFYLSLILLGLTLGLVAAYKLWHNYHLNQLAQSYQVRAPLAEETSPSPQSAGQPAPQVIDNSAAINKLHNQIQSLQVQITQLKTQFDNQPAPQPLDISHLKAQILAELPQGSIQPPAPTNQADFWRFAYGLYLTHIAAQDLIHLIQDKATNAQAKQLIAKLKQLSQLQTHWNALIADLLKIQTTYQAQPRPVEAQGWMDKLRGMVIIHPKQSTQSQVIAQAQILARQTHPSESQWHTFRKNLHDQAPQIAQKHQAWLDQYPRLQNLDQQIRQLFDQLSQVPL